MKRILLILVIVVILSALAGCQSTTNPEQIIIDSPAVEYEE